MSNQLEQAIRALLATEPDFCPDTARLDRYDRMRISENLKQALRDRYTDCWLADNERHGNP